ncbi:MAG TPA: zinc ribbon domain-containing protein [Methanoregula sp.]|nr:zinc ribbon domain-containing protein [Methanoregula sp.]
MSSENTSTVCCPKCKSPTKPGNRFCESCGAQITARCPSCGSEIDPGAKFCGNCGSPAGVPLTRIVPTGTPPAGAVPTSGTVPPASGEQILGVIGFARTSKMFGLGGDTWTLVFTDRRMIHAKLTQQMINDATREAKEAAKAAGKGFFGQMGDQMAAMGAYTRRYLAMSPESILLEVPGNSAIENQRIMAVKITIRESEDSKDTYKLLVQSGDGKSEYVIPEYNEASELLKRVYGDRADVPGGASKGF